MGDARIAAAIGLAILLLTAGCIGLGDTDDEIEPTNANDAEAPEARAVETAVDESGSFGLGVGTCAPAACYTGVGDVPPLYSHSVAPDGIVENATLTLTWEAQNPLLEDLLLALVWDCGDEDCEVEIAEGTSPVELAVEDIGEPGELTILVHDPGLSTPAGTVWATTPQDFVLEGSLTSVTNGTASAS